MTQDSKKKDKKTLYLTSYSRIQLKNCCIAQLLRISIFFQIKQDHTVVF